MIPEYLVHGLAVALVYGRMIAVVCFSVALLVFLIGSLCFGWLESNPYKKYVQKYRGLLHDKRYPGP